MPGDLLALDTQFPDFDGGMPVDARISAITDYLYMLREGLYHTLRNLSMEKNINRSSLRSYSGQLTEPIYARIEDAEGKFVTQLEITEHGIRALVADMEQGLASSITQTAAAIRSEVTDMGQMLTSSMTQTATAIRSEVTDMGQMLTSSMTQTATAIRTEVADIEQGLMSSLTQTAAAIRSEVTAIEQGLASSITQTATAIRTEAADMEQGLMSSLTQTATAIRSEVASVDGRVTAVTQTASGIQSQVTNLDGRVTTVTQTASGLQSQVTSLESWTVSSITQTANNLTVHINSVQANISSAINVEAGRINWMVRSGTNASNFTLTSRMASLVAEEINLYGLVRFRSLFGSREVEINNGTVEVYESWGSGWRTRVGGLRYDDSGAGTVSESRYRVFLFSESGTALKVESRNANMSIEARNGTVYAMGRWSFAGAIVTGLP